MRLVLLAVMTALVLGTTACEDVDTAGSTDDGRPIASNGVTIVDGYKVGAAMRANGESLTYKACKETVQALLDAAKGSLTGDVEEATQECMNS